MSARTTAAERALDALQRIVAVALAPDAARAGLPQSLCRCVAGLVEARVVGFFLLDGAMLKPLGNVVGLPTETIRLMRPIPCSPGDGGLASRVVHDGEVLDGRSGQVDPATSAPWLKKLHVAGPALVPWWVGGRPLGLLLAGDPTAATRFSDEDVWVLQAAAAAAALVWEQRRSSQRLVETKEAETDRAKRVAERMSELEQLKAHILNLAAHELRGPLAVIRGYLSMISDDSLNPKGVRRVLPILSAKATQMDALVNQMLEVARLEEGRLEVTTALVDLGAVAREAVDVVALLAPPGVLVFLERQRGSIFVNGDAMRIQTILSNLLDNAIKYSPEGGTIRCRAFAEHGEAAVSVADQGLGIATEDLPRLFTRFGRIVTPENSHISGTGLGLHLSRELARLQGGEITVETVEGKGSVFTLRLPLHAGPRPQASAETVLPGSISPTN